MSPTGSEYSLTVVVVQSAEHIEQVRTLFREYATWLEIDLCFQNFEEELAELPGDYAPPDGRLLMVHHNGPGGRGVAGCVALRKSGEGLCEMKRLFVRPQYQGHGIGRFLIEQIIRAAREIGYQRMRLDTLPPKMNKAISMYKRFGFEEISPYYENPVPGAKFMELNLAKGEARATT